MQLIGRHALIIGGTSGIGLAIAQRFVREGARVFVVGRDHEKGEAALKHIGDVDNCAHFFAADVTQVEQVSEMVRVALATLGTLDLVVNSAGVALRKTVVETTPEEWDRVLASNLRSVYLVCRATIPHLSTGTCIINIASVAGQKALPLRAAYGAAKAGVIHMTKQMAIEYAEEGIRVNCICPGGVDTDMLRRAAIAQGRDPEEALSAGARAHPLGRLGRPEEIAHAAVYLASPLADFVTGAVLNVDGGTGAR